jgi:hypothetical protein
MNPQYISPATKKSPNIYLYYQCSKMALRDLGHICKFKPISLLTVSYKSSLTLTNGKASTNDRGIRILKDIKLSYITLCGLKSLHKFIIKFYQATGKL